MSRLFDRTAAWAARLHARHVFRRFCQGLDRPQQLRQQVLRRVLRLVRGSAYARRIGLDRVQTVEELRRAVPLCTYEDLRPYVERVLQGDCGALFRPRQRLVMFALTSGTTAQRKYIPVTPQFVRDYRRGWNTFGLKLFEDHPQALLRPILQSTSRFDEFTSPAGVPCGAITGLLARTQKSIVRRYYVGTPEIARLEDPLARGYVLMRLAVERDVALAITANPATLIQMARVADENSEELIRDVRDGTVSARVVPDSALRQRIEARLRANPACAQRLELIRSRTGRLKPSDYWNLSLLACWTGGSMACYLDRLREWYGPLPVRDIGLLASEGRVSIPLDDNTPCGVLDIPSAIFEFIPYDQWESANPMILLPEDLDVGSRYVVVLTTSNGLIRYRLDDVVIVRDRLGRIPVVEFLHRAGRVSSVAGEKLTESQVIAAVAQVRKRLGLAEFDFVMSPQWGDPPFYRLYCAARLGSDFEKALDEELSRQNDEYATRRKSRRLGPLEVFPTKADSLRRFDSLMAARGPSEQYKRPALLTSLGQDACLTDTASPPLVRA